MMNSRVEFSISCQDCVRRGTPDCVDCLVSFVLGDAPEELTMTDEDMAIVGLLRAEQLIPRLRYQPSTAQR